MEPETDWILEIVGRLGGHPGAAWGLDLGLPEGRDRWLVACCLLSGRGGETRAGEAFAALCRAGLGSPAGLAGADPGTVSGLLEAASLARPEPLAVLLVRASRALVARHEGSLDVLAAGAEDLEDLARRLASLAPGLGRATIWRLLQPLRDVWPAASETPLAAGARAAGVHLRILLSGEDEEGEPGALRRALREQESPPPLADLEAALDRLGRRACLRNRRDRCPLADRCPGG